jgi:DNA-binding phage protein
VRQRWRSAPAPDEDLDRGLGRLDGLLADPEFRRAFLTEHARTLTVERIVNELEAERGRLGITKAQVARHLHASAPAVRRLLTNEETNPKLATIVDVAGALGLRVTIEPIPADETGELPPRASSPRRER